MILTKEIEIKINNKAINYYKNLGYNIKTGQLITIPIEHLSKGSNKKIEVQCHECGKINKIKYIAYLKQIKKYGFYTCRGKCSFLKKQLTSLKKYGDKNFTNKDKYTKTWKNKSKNEKKEISNKVKNTCLNRYGVEYSFQSEICKNKSRETSLLKYGTKYPSQNEKVKEKYKQTNLKNNGVEYPMQNTEIFEKNQKSGFKLKNYILPSGKIVKVQGYEPLALDLLLKKYKEKDLLIKNKDIENYIGKIWYINDIKKKRRYYPDIYIISENKIIEIKSIHYYKRDITKNLLKKQACLNMGMKFEFIVFNKKKQLLTENEIKKIN